METALNPGMCRCCASEGAFKDIKSTYHWMGEEEVYADMLRECFDVILNASGQGEDSGICEVCITQLRNAINFKKQVLHTEEQFQKHLQNKTLFRPNIVKVEMQGEEESDDNMASGDEGFSGAEYEVPIKTELEDPKPKKRAAKAAATTTRASAKKAKADNGETSTKHYQHKVATATEIKTKPKATETVLPKIKQNETAILKVKNSKQKPKTLLPPRIKHKLYKHLHNLKIILESTNATMILKHGDKGYRCCYCPKSFENPKNLKEHTLTEHQNEEKFYGNITAVGSFNFLVKLDITDLKCTLCSVNIESLEDIIVHLTEKHNKNFHSDIKNQILPFKFNAKQLKCYQCPYGIVFATFKALQEHMNRHYRYFICNDCDAGFIHKCALVRHILIHEKGSFPCRHCTVVFENSRKRGNHELRYHNPAGYSNRCHFCNERFKEAYYKRLHLVTVHGVTTPKYDCNACNMSFFANSSLRRHVRRIHLMEKKHKCSKCDMAFFAGDHLKYHMTTHTGAKDFKCEVCSKSFTRKKGLNLHMRIHNNIRLFKCKICVMSFVQHTSLKWHMKAKHANNYST